MGLNQRFNLAAADERGRLWEVPDRELAVGLGTVLRQPDAREMMPLPEGASLVLLPERVPLGYNPRGRLAACEQLLGRSSGRLTAVAALLPQGFTRTLLPAYREPAAAAPLPLFGYTAVGFHRGALWAAAVPTDEDHWWNPREYNRPDLARRLQQRRREYPGNRILEQLVRCAQEYSCFTAQNLFYRRWEAGIPVSPACNARCWGCISEQPAECCPSPQQRIRFAPTADEICQLAVPHLATAEAAIVSFGQGCEGEPSMRGEELVATVRRIRRQTARGTLNMNSNGSRPEVIAALADAGLDALRVSLISARPQLYERYHRPCGYSLEQVRESIRQAAAGGLHVSLNLLHFPGVTDRPEEAAALIELAAAGVHRIQIRNLNLDPQLFLRLAGPGGRPAGTLAWLENLRRRLPGVAIGNYSRPVR